jgi:hypothetical protein
MMHTRLPKNGHTIQNYVRFSIPLDWNYEIFMNNAKYSSISDGFKTTNKPTYPSGRTITTMPNDSYALPFDFGKALALQFYRAFKNNPQPDPTEVILTPKPLRLLNDLNVHTSFRQ